MPYAVQTDSFSPDMTEANQAMATKEFALEEQLTQTTDPLERIPLLNQLAWELRDLKPERALVLAEAAYGLAVQENQEEPIDPVGMAHSLIILGFLDWRVSKLGRAVTRGLEAVRILERVEQPAWLPRAYNVVACTYDELGNRSEALSYLVKQLALSQALQDRDQEATAYHDLGFFYQHAGERQKAIAHFETALTIFRELNDTVGVVLALSNQHSAYLALGEYNRAFACAHEALQTAQAINYTIGELLAWNALGNVYQMWRQFDKALTSYQEALHLAYQSEDPSDRVRVLTKLGQLYMEMGDDTAASAALHEALTFSEQTSSPFFQRDVHQALVDFYKARRDFEQALTHAEQYHRLKEVVFNEESERRVKALEVLQHTETARREAELLRQKNRELEREMAERKRAEQALVQAQKLESLDILAGGVAHDFNNLLTAMIGQNTLALRSLPAGHRGLQHIDKALQTMKRAANLAQQMLAYSGKGHFQILVCDLNQLIQADLQLLKSIITQATLEVVLINGALWIEADSTQLYQILMNLALNGAEAGATRITIQTYQQTISQADVHFWQHTGQPLPAGDYAALTVTDNGQGMDAITLTRLFDPFYTTKFVGRGLGLAAVLGIVRGHHGGITVTSQRGQGTTFTLLFPLTAASLTGQAAGAA